MTMKSRTSSSNWGWLRICSFFFPRRPRTLRAVVCRSQFLFRSQPKPASKTPFSLLSPLSSFFQGFHKQQHARVCIERRLTAVWSGGYGNAYACHTTAPVSEGRVEYGQNPIQYFAWVFQLLRTLVPGCFLLDPRSKGLRQKHNQSQFSEQGLWVQNSNFETS